MKGHALVVVAAVVSCVAVGSAARVEAQSDPAISRLAALAQAMQTHPVLKSSYSQMYLPAGMSLGDEESGVVQVSWPDRALFEMGQPVIRRMGLEGRQVRLLDAEAETCDDHLLTEDEWRRVPLAAVLEPEAALDRFTVLALEDGGVALIPRDAGGVARIDVLLDENSYPTRIVIEDPQGGTNTLEFDGWRKAEVPAGGWLPEPPEGISCLTVEAD